MKGRCSTCRSPCRGPASRRSADDLKARDALLRGFPEVESVIGKAGRADTPTDPAPLDMVETFVNFRPKELWPKRVLKFDPDAAWQTDDGVRGARSLAVTLHAAEQRRKIDTTLLNDATPESDVERLDETLRGVGAAAVPANSRRELETGADALRRNRDRFAKQYGANSAAGGLRLPPSRFPRPEHGSAGASPSRSRRTRAAIHTGLRPLVEPAIRHSQDVAQPIWPRTLSGRAESSAGLMQNDESGQLAVKHPRQRRHAGHPPCYAN